MSTFETPAAQPAENPNVNVPLPDEVDDDWCALFNQAYGRSGKRAVVNAYAMMRQAQPLYACRPQESRSFYEDDLGEVDENGVFMDGEVLGVRLVPIWDDFSEEYEYVLHVELTDVGDAETGDRLTRPGEEIWVPLTENGEELHLY